MGHFTVHKNDKEEFDIVCALNPKRNESPTEDEQILYVQVEAANNIIKSLKSTKNDIKQKYFDKLLSLSQVGLVGDEMGSEPNMALKSIEKLKEEILINEGQRIKGKYMVQLGIVALIISVVLILCSSLIKYLYDADLFSFVLVWISSMIGSWISFGARKFEISFEELSVIEKDQMRPAIRLIYIGLTSIIFVLFLNSGIINIELGDLRLHDMYQNNELLAVIGVICGLVESKLGISIYNRAVSIVGKE